MVNKKIIFFLVALLIVSLACNLMSNVTFTPVSTASVPSLIAVSPMMEPSHIATVTPIPAGQEDDTDSHAGYIDRDITYCTVDGIPLKLDLYFPKSTNDPAPVVVYVHGGGWSGGSKEGRAEMFYGSALLDAGFILSSVDYRLAPQHKFPAMIEMLNVQSVFCAPTQAITTSTRIRSAHWARAPAGIWSACWV